MDLGHLSATQKIGACSKSALKSSDFWFLFGQQFTVFIPS